MTAPRTRLAATLAAVGLAASFSIAAHAPDGCYVALENDPESTEDDVFACEEQHYFHTATTLANNAGFVAAPHGTATFDTNPPAGSVTGGNGGGYLLTGANLADPTAPTRAEFTGQFTGVIDRLDIDIHVLADLYNQLDQLPVYDIGFLVDLEVQLAGTTVYSAADLRLTLVPEESSQAGSMRADVAIDGLAGLLASFDFPNDPDTVHDVTFVIQPAGSDQLTVLAFDTTEVPGGIGFNRVEIPEGTTVLSAS